MLNGFARKQEGRAGTEVVSIAAPDFEDRTKRARDMTMHDPRFAAGADYLAGPE